MSREVLQMALEALIELVEFVPLLRPTCMGDERAIGHRVDRATTAITAIKEALARPNHIGGANKKAQPEQEPVAFPSRRAVERAIESVENPKGMHLNDGKERVILPGGTLRYMLALIDLASPPQRQPLTEEALYEMLYEKDWIQFARAIEAAHGIKGAT